MQLPSSLMWARVRLKQKTIWKGPLTLLICCLLFNITYSTDLSTSDEDFQDTKQGPGKVVDTEHYNAHLLKDARHKEDDFGVDDHDVHYVNPESREISDEDEDEGVIVRTSVATSTSSAISFQEVTTPIPSKVHPVTDEEAESPENLEDIIEGKVDPRDPYIEEVFPHFSQQLKSDIHDEDDEAEPDTSNLDFVDTSDFAVLNGRGEVETYGNVQDIKSTLDGWAKDGEKSKQESGLNVPGNDLQFDLSDLTKDGPTTLMLFNIFTPDEVDFLSTLVGDDALKEFRQTVGSGDQPAGASSFAGNREPDPSQLLSRRPPQFYNTEDGQDQKNVNPSFPGTGPQAFNIRESLQVYHKSEGSSNLNLTISPGKEVNPNPLQEDLYKTVEERQQKVESILNRLSEKFESARGNGSSSGKQGEDKLPSGENSTPDRMKMMIDSLKHKLSTSRPGVMSIHMEDEPLGPTPSDSPKLFHSTQAPLVRQEVESLLGEKLRGLKVGVHRLNLEELLDMDKISVQKQPAEEIEEERATPLGPGQEPQDDKSLPKRAVVHPKLTYQRPEIPFVHRPSTKLKELIAANPEPGVEDVDPSERPVIARYHEQGIPLKDFPKKYQEELASSPRPPVPPPNFSVNPQPLSIPTLAYVPTTPTPPNAPQQKTLPPRPQTVNDPFPLTKELPSFHKQDVARHTSTIAAPSSGYHPPDYSPPPIYSSNSLNNQPGVPPPAFTSQLFYPAYDSSSSQEQSRRPPYIASNTYRHSPTGVSTLSPKPKSLDLNDESANFPLPYQPRIDYKQPNLRFESSQEVGTSYIEVTPKNVPTPIPTRIPTRVPTSYYTSSTYPSSYSSTYSPSYSSTYTPPTNVIVPDDKVKSLHTRPILSALPPRTYSPPALPTKSSPAHVSSLPQQNDKTYTTTPKPLYDYSTPIPSYPSRGSPSGLSYVSSLSLPSRNSDHEDYHNGFPKQQAYLESKTKDDKIGMQPPTLDYASSPISTTTVPPSKDYLPPVVPTDKIATLQLPDKGYLPPAAHLPQYMQTPEKHYLPPSLAAYDQIQVPDKSYLPPAGVPPSRIGALQVPDQNYLPPGNIEAQSHGDSGHNYDAMTHMIPPSESYQPPATPQYDLPGYGSDRGTLHPPTDDYLAPINSYISAMAPPFKNFFSTMLHQFTKISPPASGSDFSGDTLHYKSLTTPSYDYLPPTYSTTIAPPGQDYGIPDAKGGVKIQLPSKDYLLPEKSLQMSPPISDYLPPTYSTTIAPPGQDYGIPDANGGVKIQLPSKDYLPPEKSLQMYPPNSDYLPPPPDYQRPDSLVPPSKEYLPVALPSLEPPGRSYLPPYDSKGLHIMPPKDNYVAPTPGSHGTQYVPPPDSNPVTDYKGTKLSPPSKSYLPPKDNYNGPTTMVPPGKDYEAPANYMSTMGPPLVQYQPPTGHNGVPYSHPTSDYIAPSYHATMDPPTSDYIVPSYHATMDPPTGDYVPPHEGSLHGSTIVPPTYLQHNPVDYLEKLNPPKDSYLPPPPPLPGYHDTDLIHPPAHHHPKSLHIPPNPAFLVPSQEHFHLRPGYGTSAPFSSKRILDDIPDYNGSEEKQSKGNGKSLFGHEFDVSTSYLPPNPNNVHNSKKDSGIALKAPSKDYLPPARAEDAGGPQPDSSMHPPSKDYLLPDELLNLEESLLKYHPPANEYSPPSVNNHKVSVIQVPGKEYLHPQNQGSSYSPPKVPFVSPEPGEKVVGVHPPSSDYIPPTVKQGVTFYNPPTFGYTSPERKLQVEEVHLPQEDFVAPDHEHSGTNLHPPNDNFLAPRTDVKTLKMRPPSKGFKSPSLPAAGGIGLALPVAEFLIADGPVGTSYLPPTLEHDASPTLVSTGMKAPEIDYKPPDKDGMASYKPPSEEYQSPTKNGLEAVQRLPDKVYLPPKELVPAGHLTEPVVHQLPPKDRSHGLRYQPPSKEYLPPSKFDDSYEPPSNSYSLPSTAARGSKLRPPGPDLLVPANPLTDGVKYHPPNKGYEAPSGLEGSAYAPPSKEYLPPGPGEVLGASYLPPGKEYSPPSVHPHGEELMHPPHSEYVPPGDHHAANYHPPQKEYLPPSPELSGLHMKPPATEYVPPKEHPVGTGYRPPEKDYLPPAEKSHHGMSYTPPNKEYLPPKDGGIHGDSYEPPSKEYLPPKEAGHVLLPPSGPYSDPSSGGGHYKPPSYDYSPPQIVVKGVGYLPPSKDYQVPKELVIVADISNLKPLAESYSPPSKDYLPPAIEVGPHHVVEPVKVHALPDLRSHGPFHPPSIEYKPPGVDPLLQHYHPPSVDYLPPSPGLLGETFKPPTSEYLPPAPSAVHLPNLLVPRPDLKLPILDEKETLLPPSKAYLPPPPPSGVPTLDPDYNAKVPIPLPQIGVTVNGQLEHHSVNILDNDPKYSGMPPSINIQINIPNKDKDHHGLGPLPHLHPTTEPLILQSTHLPHLPLDPHPENVVMPHLFNYDHQGDGPNKDVIMPNLFVIKHPPGSPSGDYNPPDVQYSPPSYTPQKQYVPVKHRLPPKEYLPTRGKDSPYQTDHDPNLPEYDPSKGPKDLLEEALKGDFLPAKTLLDLPGKDYLAPPPASTLTAPSEGFSLPSDGYLPPPPEPEEVLSDLLQVPSRGPQFPIKGDLKLSTAYGVPSALKSKYKDPPPRTIGLLIEPPPPVLNSQAIPPAHFEDQYIPPKTKYDVPRNFTRLTGSIDVLDGLDQTLPQPPPPESIPDSIDEEVEEFPLGDPDAPEPFLGLAKLRGKEEVTDADEKSKKSSKTKSEKLTLKNLGPKLPPMPTLPPQPDTFSPLLEQLKPSLLQQLQQSLAQQDGVRGQSNFEGKNFIPGKPGIDYPDFKVIPVTDFSCESFILEGFYADTFTSCQVFHVCESGKRQSSFLCPKGTIFNQKHRVCDWWYNVKCEESPEFYDLNLDLLLLEKGSTGLNIGRADPKIDALKNLPPPIDPIATLGIDSGLLDGGTDLLELTNMLDGLDDPDDFISKRRLDLGVDDEVRKLAKRKKSSKKKSKQKTKGSVTNEVEDLSDIANLGDLSSILEMLTAESKNKETQSNESPEAPGTKRPRRKRRRNRNRRRKTIKNIEQEVDEVAKKFDEIQKVSLGGDDELTLCQLVNICDKIPSATDEYPSRSENPFNNVPFAASSSVQSMVVDSPETVSLPPRTGEKTAAEVAQIITRSNQARKFDSEEDEDSHPVDQFDMSQTAGRNKLIAINSFYDDDDGDQDSAGSNYHESVNAERSPKMIDESQGTIINDPKDKNDAKKLSKSESKTNEKLPGLAKDHTSSNPTTAPPDVDKWKPDPPAEKSPFPDVAIDTSQFDVSAHNIDDDFMTWRPLKLTHSGELQMEVSEVMTTSDGENIVTVLSSDSWIPNSGPILKERD